MQNGLSDNTNPIISEILISSEIKAIKRPTKIRLSASSINYDIQSSYLGKTVFDICYLCHKSLSKDELQLTELCLKIYVVNPWPSLLFENNVSLTPFKQPTCV